MFSLQIKGHDLAGLEREPEALDLARREIDSFRPEFRWGKEVIADVTQLGYASCGGAEAFVTWNQRATG